VTVAIRQLRRKSQKPQLLGFRGVGSNVPDAAFSIARAIPARTTSGSGMTRGPTTAGERTQWIAALTADGRAPPPASAQASAPRK
jgi:hypothetical protein